MLIIYDSKTGNVQRFVNKLNLQCIKVETDLLINEPYILLTYTTGMGQISKSTIDFLDRNYSFLIGVACSGNKVWGNNYGAACDTISKKYSVPLLMKFELSGTKNDVERFYQEVSKIVESNSQVD